MDMFKPLMVDFPRVTTDPLDLHFRKQVDPDEFTESWDRFIETSLPPHGAF